VNHALGEARRKIPPHFAFQEKRVDQKIYDFGERVLKSARGV
jgi:hypothetical protein